MSCNLSLFFVNPPQLNRLSLTAPPWKVVFFLNWEGSSSNHHFSGAMLSFGGVFLNSTERSPRVPSKQNLPSHVTVETGKQSWRKRVGISSFLLPGLLRNSLYNSFGSFKNEHVLRISPKFDGFLSGFWWLNFIPIHPKSFVPLVLQMCRKNRTISAARVPVAWALWASPIVSVPWWQPKKDTWCAPLEKLNTMGEHQVSCNQRQIVDFPFFPIFKVLHLSSGPVDWIPSEIFSLPVARSNYLPQELRRFMAAIEQIRYSLNMFELCICTLCTYIHIYTWTWCATLHGQLNLTWFGIIIFN